MIVKRYFHPLKVWGYVRWPMLFSLAWAALAWALRHFSGIGALHFTPVGVLGSALAIFVAFRNNSAYGRWWEARTIWGGIVNASRVFARLVITFADSHAHQANYDAARSAAFKRSLVLKQVAWVNALRLQLRGQEAWEELSPFLSAEELAGLRQKQHKPNALQMLMGQQIYRAMADGTLGGFDSFQMEGQLLALANYQGGAERIKNTPLPRQYDFFTRLFVWLFAAVLPFGLLGLLPDEQLWLLVPLSGLIAGVFIIMERTGAANEDPFENRITDVALTAICNTIERDLREMLGDTELPPKAQPVDGYLF